MYAGGGVQNTNALISIQNCTFIKIEINHLLKN